VNRTRLIIVLALFLVAPVWCQTAASPRFEVASVKQAEPDRTASCRGGPGSADPIRFVCTAWPLRLLIVRAWDLTPMALSAPNAIDNAHYTINASVPPKATREEFNLMLRQLLTEEVGLIVHHESREQAVFEMVVAKSGLKMPEAEAAPPGEAVSDASPPRLIRDKNGNQVLPPGRSATVVGALPGGMYRMSARMQPISRLASALEGSVGRRVIDKTGLTAKYDFTLDYMPDTVAHPNTGMPVPVSADSASPGPNFVQAVSEQLGLKLQSGRATVDVLVVDRFNKVPAGN
jgi:uncharacterized protein (TIGR03435 family)